MISLTRARISKFRARDNVFLKLCHLEMCVIFFCVQVCTNVNKCFCNPGWSGTDCSIVQSIPTPSTTSTLEPVNKPDNKMVKKETPYGKPRFLMQQKKKRKRKNKTTFFPYYLKLEDKSGKLMRHSFLQNCFTSVL